MKFKYILLFVFAVLLSNTLTAKNKNTDTTSQSKKIVTEVVTLSKAEFLEKVFNYEKNPTEWKYEGNMPCIIDFYATWCGPCKLVAPILDDLAKEYAGKIVIYKIDTDKEKELSAALGITGLPTILFCPTEGAPAGQMGAQSKTFYKQAIDQFLLGEKKATTAQTTTQVN